MGQRFAEIAVFSALEKTLHYLIPPELSQKVQPGVRALVPLGRREASGLVVAVVDAPPDADPGIAFRPLLDVLDASPVVPADLVSLCRWMSSYYFYPLGETLQAALPSTLLAAPQALFRLTTAGRDALGGGNAGGLLGLFSEAEPLSLDEITERLHPQKNIAGKLRGLEKEGLIERFFKWGAPLPEAKKAINVRLVNRPDAIDLEKHERLRELVSLLDVAGGVVSRRELRQKVKGADYWLKKLLKLGVIQTEEIEEIRESHYAQHLPAGEPPELTAEQTEVVQTVTPYLHDPEFRPFLLFGVTGSGKTEVYLRLVEATLEKGRGALVLVPEIALSTQMEALFRQRFGAQLAIWHSGLSQGTRFDQWREVLEGKRKVVLGVRSAIFMPLRDLGLILVDEEHDSSYKQEDHLRYNARDVALVRARALGVPVVLASATPSLQSVHHALSDRYHLLSLNRRVLDRPPPNLGIVDMRRQSKGNRVLSHEVRIALSETIESGRQALVFLNRRGFATFYLCSSCGQVIECTHCSVSLTYHQKDDMLRCHYCGFERGVPERCPACGSASLIPHGFGTERVEEEVKRALPAARIVRIDRDTVSHSRRLVEFLDAVRNERANVLIGTQMIAKGHDFPNITLVVVVNADMALQIPDFRSGENTVQLLIQVSGRAGRGEEPGRVLLQTYNPIHYTIESVLRMDYLEFCRKELESRERLQYPPYVKLLRLLVTTTKEDEAERAAAALSSLCHRVSDQMRTSGRRVAILGPAPAPIARLNRRFRWHIFVKAWTSRELQEFTEEVLSHIKTAAPLRRAHVTVDRDPLTSL